MTSWLFGGAPKSNLPPITPLQEQRSKQILSLKTQNPSVVELQRDLEYRLTVATGANTVALIIALPPLFPQDKPIVKVSPALSHPWVSKSLKVTGCPSLTNFGVHSDLGRVIQSVVQELRQNPPVVFSTAEPDQQPILNPPYTPQPSMQLPGQSGPPQRPPLPQRLQQLSTHDALSPGRTTGVPSQSAPVDVVEMLGVEPTVPPTGLINPGATYQPPPFTTLMNELQLRTKSMAELQELYDNEAKVMEIIKDSVLVKQMLSDRTQLYEDCENLSETNLSYKPEIEKLKDQLLEKVQERNELKNKFDRNCLQQQGLSERFQPQNLLDNLRVSAAEAEHDSEKLADSLLEAKLPIEDFLRQYMDLRKTLHLKKAKEEKLDHMIQNSAIKY